MSHARIHVDRDERLRCFAMVLPASDDTFCVRVNTQYQYAETNRNVGFRARHDDVTRRRSSSICRRC